MNAPVTQQTPAARRWLGRHGGLVALLAGLTWAFFYPFSANMREGLATWGDPMLQYWTMAWPVHLLRADPWRLPQRLFEANIFWPYPHTLAYTDHLLGETLLVLPAILLSGQVALGLNLAVLLMTFLTALGAYLWLSDLTGNRVAGLAAALPAAFAPYKLANIAHLHVLASGGLVLALWALTRVWRGGGWRWSVLLAGAVILQGLTSIYYFYALLVGLAVTLGYLVLAEWRVVRWRHLARLLVALGLGFLLLVPFFWPYLLVTRELGITRTIDETLDWSAAPNWYLRVTQNNFFWSGILRRFGGGSPERLLFPGVVAPVLALVGLVASWRRERWLFLGLAGAGFVLTFGPYQDVGSWRIPLPYWLLYEVVPGFSALRVPTRFVVLVLVGLGGLAGLGVEALGHAIARWLVGRGAPGGRRRGSTRRAGGPGAVVVPRRVALAGLLGGVVVLTGLSGVEYATHTGNTGAVAGAIDAPVYRWLAANGTGPVVELPFPELGAGSALTNLASTVYWRPNLGGNSGFVPPAYDGMQKILADFPSAASISLLEGLEVEHIVLHTDSLSGERRVAIEQAMRGAQDVREVARFGPDIVYALRPNPWMNDLVRATPGGAPVAFPDVEAAPTVLELLGVFYQRAGHEVTGSGTAGYHRFALPPNGVLPADAVLAATSDPLLYGYLPEEAVRTAGGLTLYHRVAGGRRGAVMLSDPALPGSPGARPSFTVRVDGDGISAAPSSDRPGGGPPRSAVVAFVIPEPGEVTIRAGTTVDRVALPAGLAVYRTAAVATPATITIEAPAGGTVYGRWARLDTGGVRGIVATRPLVLVDATVRQLDRATVAVGATVLPGAATGLPLTLTLDIYQRPYGTHPNGHYGYWSVVVPPGARTRRIEITFNIETKAAAATLDGAWTPVVGWSGPPHEWGFRATLTVHRGENLLGATPLFEFALKDWRVRDLEVDRSSPRYLPPAR